VLFEVEPELGGKLIVASGPEFKKDLQRFLDYLKQQVPKAGVEVRINTPATPELISDTNPDVLIVVTGARPVAAEDRGIAGSGAMQTMDILMGGEIPGETLIVVGGGYLGCETALYLAQ